VKKGQNAKDAKERMRKNNIPSVQTDVVHARHTKAMLPTTNQKPLAHRVEQQSATPSRVRSRPIQPSTTRPVHDPVSLAWEPESRAEARRDKPLVVGLALLAWLVALAFLLTTPSPAAQISFLPRLLTPLVWALAASVTFIPLQIWLALPHIGWQGVVGWGLLGYLLAFVPPPTGSLLELPDVPVYLLFFLAIFYATITLVMPFIYLLSQRIYKLRIHRHDLGRIRRQAYEIGVLVVAVLGMAGMRVLSPLTFGLTVLVLVLTEVLLLSQMQPKG
jgi:hypothetical protein